MNSLPASEVKRRGVAALEEAARRGPVHVIRNNRPAGVYMSEADYARLLAAARPPRRAGSGVDVWDLILNRPYVGTRTGAEIETELREERKSWGDR
jgi:hypothetical protein